MTRGRMRAPRFALGMSRLAAGRPLTGTAFIPGLKAEAFCGPSVKRK